MVERVLLIDDIRACLLQSVLMFRLGLVGIRQRVLHCIDRHCVMWHFLSHMDSLHRFGSYSLTQVHYSSGSGLILNLRYFLRHSLAFLYTLAVFYLKCRGWFRATLAWLIIL